MNAAGKVSVIVPTYNRATIIGRTIDSVLSQTHENFELIVVDDFSDDFAAMLDVISSYHDARIRVIRNPKNLNGAASRNVGIMSATGEYIAFLDSDDCWLPAKLEKQVALAQTLRGNFLIYTKSHVVRRRFSEILPRKPIAAGQCVADYLFVDGEYMPTPSLFLPSYLAKEALFNEALNRHQDYDFLLGLEKLATRFVMIDEVLVTVYANASDRSEARGASFGNSLYFLDHYAGFLSERARNYFWIRNVGFYMSRGGMKARAIRCLFGEGRYRHIDARTLATFALYYLTVNTFAFDLLEKLYLHLHKKA